MLGQPHRDYLLALASAPRLFSAGCEGIHHMQLVSYYRALVMAPNDQIRLILPGQSAAWYKKFFCEDDAAEKETSALRLS